MQRNKTKLNIQSKTQSNQKANQQVGEEKNIYSEEITKLCAEHKNLLQQQINSIKFIMVIGSVIGLEYVSSYGYSDLINAIKQYETELITLNNLIKNNETEYEKLVNLGQDNTHENKNYLIEKIKKCIPEYEDLIDLQEKYNIENKKCINRVNNYIDEVAKSKVLLEEYNKNKNELQKHSSLSLKDADADVVNLINDFKKMQDKVVQSINDRKNLEKSLTYCTDELPDCKTNVIKLVNFPESSRLENKKSNIEDNLNEIQNAIQKSTASLQESSIWISRLQIGVLAKNFALVGLFEYLTKYYSDKHSDRIINELRHKYNGDYQELTTYLKQANDKLRKNITRNEKLAQVGFCVLSVYFVVYTCLNKTNDIVPTFLMIYSMYCVGRIAFINPLNNAKNSYNAKRLTRSLVEQKNVILQIIPSELIDDINIMQGLSLGDSKAILTFNKYAGIKSHNVAYMIKTILQKNGIKVLAVNNNQLTIAVNYPQIDIQKLKTFIMDYFARSIEIKQFREQLFVLTNKIGGRVWILPENQDDNNMRLQVISLDIPRAFSEIINSQVLDMFPHSEIIPNENNDEIYTIIGYHPADQKAFEILTNNIDKFCAKINLMNQKVITDTEIIIDKTESTSSTLKIIKQKKLSVKNQNKTEKIISENKKSDSLLQIRWPSGEAYNSRAENRDIYVINNLRMPKNTFFVKLAPTVANDLSLSGGVREKAQDIVRSGQLSYGKGSQGIKFGLETKIKLLGGKGKGDTRIFCTVERGGEVDHANGVGSVGNDPVLYIFDEVGDHKTFEQKLFK